MTNTTSVWGRHKMTISLRTLCEMYGWLPGCQQPLAATWGFYLTDLVLLKPLPDRPRETAADH